MTNNHEKLIILDRDGVINHDSPGFIRTPREWVAIPGSLEAIARFFHAGYRVLVATNQSGIGRGLFDFDDLAAMHDKMQRLLGELGGRIDGVFFCPHAPEAECPCRKPAPGLFRDIEKRLGIDLNGITVVGDSLRDLKAAQAVSARPVLVRTGTGAELERENPDELAGVSVYDDLAALANKVLE
jgi:D-glycero-D-manno-heptose 1,7-bisphosphate phosphatase